MRALIERIFKITGVGGRAGFLRDWKELEQLFSNNVLPHLDASLVRDLLGKDVGELHPEQNDLKALCAYGVHAGWVTADAFRHALASADASSPLWFLAGKSGKTFGETVAPVIAEFYLLEPGDQWEKMPSTELYDIAWSPRETGATYRIELKASSERNPRFQQIRPPRMKGGRRNEYDALLCLGVFRDAIEWWLLPAEDVTRLMEEHVITQQHNAGKHRTDSYWCVVDADTRAALQACHIPSSRMLRDTLLDRMGGADGYV